MPRIRPDLQLQKSSTVGSILVTNGSNDAGYLAPGATGTVLFVVAGVPGYRAIIAGDIPILNQNTTGSAATLTTPRTIGGVSFDGSANITVLTATGGFTISGGNLALGTNNITLTGSIGSTGARVLKGWFTDLEVTNAIIGSITGNAGSATILQTGRTIGITGDATWTSPSFNGSTNIAAAITLATVNINIGSFGSSTSIPTFTVNGKGLITAASSTVIPTATTSVTGLLTFTDWNTFNNKGIGSVTSVSIITANGISGSVATSTSTPAITLTLGAITPSSVNTVVISGASIPTLAVTGTSSISGANTGDNAVNSLYSGLISNVTHTGDATGATTLTVVGLRGVTLPILGVSAGFLRYTGTGTNTWVFDANTYLTTAVTSVSGTGTVSGLTLTGTVTTTGSLTLGGTLSLTSGNVTTALGFTPYNATNPNGYISSLPSHSIGTHSDVTITTPVNRNLLVYNGSSWVNRLLVLADVSDYSLAAVNYWTLTSDNVHRATGNVIIGSASSVGAFALQVTGNSYFSGNVGIGTTSPTVNLHIDQAGTGSTWCGRIASINSSMDRAIFMGTYNGNAVLASHSYVLNAWKPLFLNTVNGTDGGNVIIGSNVGIGTTTPTYKLHVKGGNANSIGIDNDGSTYTELDYLNNGTLRALTYWTEGGAASEFTIRTVGAHGIGFDTNLTRAMTIKSGGNVGIGTVNPLYKLHTVGVGLFTTETFGNASVESGYRIKFRDYGGILNDTGIGIENEFGALWFNNISGGGYYFNGGTDGRLMTILGTGNVGIGTPNPTEKLDVRGYIGIGAGASSLPAYILQGYLGGGNNHTLNIQGHALGTNDSVTFNLSRGGGAYGDFAVDFVGVRRFYIGGNTINANGWVNVVGNFGIGTTNPNSRLEVAGNVGISPNSGGTRYLFIPTATDTYTGSLHIQSGAGSSGFGGAINLYGHSHATKPGWVVAGISVGSGTVGNANEGRFAVHSSGLAEGSELFTVLRSGNVGIGTTTPTHQLQVVGAIRQSGATSAIVRADASGILVNATGAEIATALGQASGNYIQNQNSSVQAANAWINGEYRSNTIVVGGNSAQYPTPLNILASTHATSRRAAINLGNFGQIVSDVTANGTNDFALYNGLSGTWSFFINQSTNNVGINTINPSDRLHILAGSINIDFTTNANQFGIIKKGGERFLHDFNYGVIIIPGGTITTLGNNTFLGRGAGNLTMGSTATLNYESSYNTGIGAYSLYSNTTGYNNTVNGYASLYANTTGYSNTANGVSSLQSNTTGYNNTANGVNSLFANTTGYFNTANGVNSLQSNTTGYYNTANGESSLRFNTTGYYNTANGVGSLQSNTTGYYNTAIGYASLYSNTTGNNNTANGAFSLYANTTGNTNTANGLSSLYSNTTGYYNTANGVGSLQSNTTGFYNTGIGIWTLQSNTTGNLNTAIGSQSLYSNTTGSNNTALGQNALLSNTTGVDNTAIGLNALYTNTTGSNNVAIGTYSSSSTTTGVGNVGIGFQSFYSNTTGTNNVATGLLALYSATTGSNNVAVGGYGLYDTTTASLNTVIGYNTGRGITTGIKNTIIGANVTGLPATLSNNIILADGDGNRRINVNSVGYVGIGITDPTERLHINGYIRQNVYTSSLVYADAGGAFVPATSGPNGTIVSAIGDNYIKNNSTVTPQAASFRIAGTGFAVAFFASGNVTSGSDRKLKTQIVDYKNIYEKVKDLNLKQYIKFGKNEIGYIAQDVQHVFPEMVENHGGTLGLNYGSIGAVALQLGKETRTEVELLKERVLLLEAKLEKHGITN